MSSPFPPAYSIRVSKRAKRPGLRIRQDLGLEVVLPHSGWRSYPVNALLERFRPWIEKHYPRIMQNTPPVSRPGESGSNDLPPGFFLAGGTKYVAIAPHAPASEHMEALAKQLLPKVSLSATALKNMPIHQVSLPCGTSGNPDTSYHWLREWVRGQARNQFTAELLALAHENALRVNKCSVRFQKTRWGSCSIHGNISLNACLLFLPPQLSRYILLHELCHLRQLNHSNAFWKEVFTLEPRALEYDKALRSAWKYVPFWARQSL